MVQRVGILVVSYGSRAAAMIDAFTRSTEYKVELYIADKQKNPFNLEKATIHQVIPDFDIESITKFAGRFKDRIDFGICGPEGPIIEGIRDRMEEELDIPMVCPTQEYAIEVSKVAQREFFAKACPGVNPRYKVFRKEDYSSDEEVKKEINRWLNELDNQVAVKPDRPGYGKGVGVWGDHFKTRSELIDHFMTIYAHDAVIIEEKVDGEESSFQCFCDGKKIIALPESRDYKRAFENDEGANTGGMGCYTDFGGGLPFINEKDQENEFAAIEKLFNEIKKEDDGDGLRGIPFYSAFMHTKDGLKILEINSRGGDPEIATVLPLLKNDFVDVCMRMIDGNLKKLEFDPRAAVLTYKVPHTYGGYDKAFPEKIYENEIGTPIDLKRAYELKEEFGEDIRIYPGSMELKNGQFYPCGSRTLCCVGIGDSIEKARFISQQGLKNVYGAGLWYRTDVASTDHINKSITHMKELRE